jgi:hypothetical protein
MSWPCHLICSPQLDLPGALETPTLLAGTTRGSSRSVLFPSSRDAARGSRQRAEHTGRYVSNGQGSCCCTVKAQLAKLIAAAGRWLRLRWRQVLVRVRAAEAGVAVAVLWDAVVTDVQGLLRGRQSCWLAV